MPPRRRADPRGFALVGLLVGAAIGAIVLAIMSFLYVATVRSFDESSSQAALQRVGALAVQAISRQASRASNVVLYTSPGSSCAPSATGRVLKLTVTDTVPPSLPSAQIGDYCYYASAGALCQSFSPGTTNTFGACWNLLAPRQAGLSRLSRQTGISQPGTMSLIRAPSPFCPRNTDTPTVDLATGLYCLALNAPSSGTVDVAFAITDGLNSMTFTASLMRQN